MQQHGQVPQGPVGSQAAPVNVPAQQAGTSVNIAILDSKDFPAEVAPIAELHSAFSMVDGTSLFDCPGLLKSTGIDLMNCPLSVVLRLQVRRTTPHGPMVLWHVVLPLPIISKHLMSPPHEWETWIGLFANSQDLNAHPADVMFTQAVHLISRPEFPKLRLRFTYHNSQLQAHALAQQEREEQETKRLEQLNQQVGKAQFQDIFNLMSSVRESNNPSVAAAAAAAAGPLPSNATRVVATPAPPATDPSFDPLRETQAGVVQMNMAANQQPAEQGQRLAPIIESPGPSPVMPNVAPQPAARAGTISPAGYASPPEQAVYPAADAGTTMQVTTTMQREDKLEKERLKDALAGALRFITNVQAAMASQVAKTNELGLTVPPRLEYTEILAGSQSAIALDTHCLQLRQCLEALLAQPSSAPQAGPPSTSADIEPLLVEGLRAVLNQGSSFPGDERMRASVQERFPRFWEVCREVSSLSAERASLADKQRRSEERCSLLQEECAKLSQDSNHWEQQSKDAQSKADKASRSDTQKHFEKLLNQQREALTRNSDEETSNLRRQLEEMRRTAQDKEAEVAQLRAQVAEFMKTRSQKNMTMTATSPSM